MQPDLLHKSLTAATVVPGLVLQGVVESKEAKGYMLEFGLKDKSKGFLSNSEQSIQLGQRVLVVVRESMASSKIIKCDLAEGHQKNLNNKEVTIHNIKPGTLVNGKVSSIMQNGIEISFLTGFKGTIFADHLDKSDPSKYKLNDKVSCRIIYVDPQTQTISLSMLPHIIKLSNVKEALTSNGLINGKVYENAKVIKCIYGGSY